MDVNIYVHQCYGPVLGLRKWGWGQGNHEKLRNVVEGGKRVLRFARDDKGWEGIG
jgi:hypothetical protein